MSHPTYQSNGVSLEDCHTNLFALTDLAGIKWRRWKYERHYCLDGPLDDPVLLSFTRCLQADILCVWRRRVPRYSHHNEASPAHQLACNKELWVFWYGQEPANLHGLLAPELQEEEQGQWDYGLSYECRTLLFKALHNLIERCLLSQNFVRLGKWFVQPYSHFNHSINQDASLHLSIRFSFFLHGESTVCASIDVRQHPPLRALHPQHLLLAQQAGPPGAQVLLAPYGLSATLTGQSYKESEHSTQKLLDEWRQFYVLPQWDVYEGLGEPYLPPAVEVTIAGVRMRYPTAFVLIATETEAELLRQHGNAAMGAGAPAVLNASMSAPATSLTPPSSPVANTLVGQQETSLKVGAVPGYMGPVVEPNVDHEGPSALGRRVVEKVWHDCAITSGVQSQSSRHQQHADQPASAEDGASWDFGEPAQKNSCVCSRSRGPKRLSGGQGKPGINGSGKHIKGEKGEKPDKEKPSRHSRGSATFHRRQLNDDLLQQEVDFMMQRIPSSSLANVKSSSSVQGSGLPSLRGSGSSGTSSGTTGSSNSSSGAGGGGGGGGGGAGGGGANFDQSVDSPPDAPSPLPSQTQQLVNQNGDPTMPTLSPHPPQAKSCEKDLGASSSSIQTLDISQDSTTANQNTSTGAGTAAAASAALNTSANNSNGPVSGSAAAADLQGKPPESGAVSVKMEAFPTAYLNGGGTTADTIKVENVNTWLDSQKEKQCTVQLMRRPQLPVENYEAGEEARPLNSLYDFDGLNAWLELPVKRQKVDHDIETPSLVSTLAQALGPTQMGRPPLECSPPGHGHHDPPHDPYEFSDESSSNAGNFPKRPLRASREDSFQRPSPFGSKQEEEHMRRSSDSNFSMNDDYRNSIESPATPGNAGVPTSLTTEKDLVPTITDLDHLFETDSDNDNDPFQPVSPSNSTKGGTEERSSKTVSSKACNITSSVNPNVFGPNPIDLQRMFPTPPSQENQQNLSPCQMMADAPADMTVIDTAVATKIEPVILPKILEDPNKDWSYVYKPPTVCVMLGSTKYSPIDLPSSRLEPLSALLELSYKPSWQQYHHHQLPVIDKHTQHHHQQQQQHTPGHYTNVPSVENIGSVPKATERMTSVEASPATFGGPSSAQQRTPRTPMSYELQSPASNASSYLNKNMNSVDNHASTNCALPEIPSLVVNVMMSDSILNLFKDHNFDSCPMCVCNTNIKGSDMGLYLVDHTHEDQCQCMCAFSAVVNRRFGANAGLFYEDEVDITGARSEHLEHRKPSLISLLNKDGATTAAKDGGGLAAGTDSMGEAIPQDALLLLLAQFSTLFPSCAVTNTIGTKHPALTHTPQDPINFLEYHDGCEACLGALEVGRQMSDNSSPAQLDTSHRNYLLHKWPYLQSAAKIPTNSQDVVRLLKSLQPILQDAIQKKRTRAAWESVYNIMGPLSWKDFHLLAGRGSEESSAPQPIPHLLLGYEKDWLSLSPHSLKFWDKLMLEPYGRPRDIAYVIVAPDNDYILPHVRTFFKELSQCYELCRLGRHRPASEKLRDGIMRVGKSSYAKVAQTTLMQDWFNSLGVSTYANKLRMYAQVCSKTLAPFLATIPLDKSIFETPSSSSSSGGGHKPLGPRPPHDLAGSSSSSSLHTSGGSSSNLNAPSNTNGVAQSAMQSSSLASGAQQQSTTGQSTTTSSTTSSTPQQNPGDAQGANPSQSNPNNADDKDAEASQSQRDAGGDLDSDLSEADTPALVVYMVDPFSYGDDWEDVNRLSMLGLLRCFQEMLHALPEHLQHNTQLQIVPQQSIVDFQEGSSSQALKKLCMSVYTQSRRLVNHVILGRSLTGFGPAAAADKILKSPKEPGRFGSIRHYSPPYILAAGKSRQSLLAGPNDDPTASAAGVMLCAYCLSEDQRWVLAVCTDNFGEIMETCSINVDIPNRNRRKKASARKIGLHKLWDFIMGILSMSARPWRLVIGRFGRLGHGELKGWAGILSKKHLQQASRQLAESCRMCGIVPTADTPCILSACLISMEVHQSIHIMTDSVKMEEKSSSSCPLSTPRDASATHILVFPTSATAQANQPVNPQETGPGDSHLGSDMDIPEGDDIFKIVGSDMGDMGGIGIGLDDIFSQVMPEEDSPKNPSLPGSPLPGSHGGGGGMGMMNGMVSGGPSMSISDVQEETHALLQQPLAMGFYVSTASTGPLPKWFWSACPGREGLCPNCLKAALHIHCPAIQVHTDEHDEFSQQYMPKHPIHPLDSGLTCDVLRYVLETYNALSWLTYDPASNDRRSCLPSHFVVLMQMYHAMNEFV